jgi:hypothetical protein
MSRAVPAPLASLREAAPQIVATGNPDADALAGFRRNLGARHPRRAALDDLARRATMNDGGAAVLFDFNGVIVDDEEQHRATLSNACRRGDRSPGRNTTTSTRLND